MVNIAITLSLINLVMFVVIVVLVIRSRRKYNRLYKQAVNESLKIAERALNLVSVSLQEWEKSLRMTGIIPRASSKGVKDGKK